MGFCTCLDCNHDFEFNSSQLFPSECPSCGSTNIGCMCELVGLGDIIEDEGEDVDFDKLKDAEISVEFGACSLKDYGTELASGEGTIYTELNLEPFKCKCGGHFEIYCLVSICNKCYKIIPLTIPEGMSLKIDFYPKPREEEGN